MSEQTPLKLTPNSPPTSPQPNALIDRARIRGASRMIAQGTEAKNVTPDQITQVAADVELFCKANAVTRKAVATAVGYSAGVVSEFLKGNYKGDSGQIAIDLDDWLIEEEQRRAKQEKPQFVWTNVANHIRSIAAYCLDYKKVGLVYGPDTSGLGKSTSLQAIHQEMGPRRSALITLDKCDANPTGLLRKILAALRLDNTGSNAQKMHSIIAELSGRSHLLMIDQIHNLRYATEDRPYYYLMDIFDATQTAQLWAGTSNMLAYLTRQQTKTLDEPLAQIRRRIFPCVDIVESLTGGPDGNGSPLFTVDQIRDMYARHTLKLTSASSRWLCSLARVPGSGGLGIVRDIVEYATMLAQIRKTAAIDVDLLKEALRNCVTNTRVTELLMKTATVMESAKIKVA
jgi:hypothetical protein